MGSRLARTGGAQASLVLVCPSQPSASPKISVCSSNPADESNDEAYHDWLYLPCIHFPPIMSSTGFLLICTHFAHECFMTKQYNTYVEW
jgi:hypothetical protein